MWITDNVAMDEMNDQVMCLSLSLRDEGYAALNKSNVKSEALFSEELLHRQNRSLEQMGPLSLNDAEVHLIDSDKLVGKGRGNVIIHLDDDEESALSDVEKIQSHLGLIQHSFDDNAVCPNPVERIMHSIEEKYSGTSSLGYQSEILCEESHGVSPITGKLETDDTEGRQRPKPDLRLRSIENKEKKMSPKCSANYFCSTQNESDLKSSNESIDSGRIGSSKSQLGCKLQTPVDPSNDFKIKDQQSIDKVLEKSDFVINEVVHNREDDSWDFAFFKSARPQKSLFSKPSNHGAKRQVIQLNLPVENRSGNWRVNVEMRRLKAPRLDDWYKPILELDYFVTVGLASEDKRGDKMFSKLKEVPVCFKSPDEYVEVFRPLVLEEFKAQLHSSFQEMTSIEEICFGGLSVLSVERIDDFHIVRCVHDGAESTGSRSFLENDLILLTRKPLSRSSHDDIHMVGKVGTCIWLHLLQRVILFHCIVLVITYQLLC